MIFRPLGRENLGSFAAPLAPSTSLRQPFALAKVDIDVCSQLQCSTFQWIINGQCLRAIDTAPLCTSSEVEDVVVLYLVIFSPFLV